MNCYSCDATAVNACKRCARPYCDDHGNASYCAECLQPASALPSFNLYRGALLVMLVGTALAVVLILRPPGETKGAAPVVIGRSLPTPTVAGGSSQATVPARTPDETGTAAASATGTPATGTPASGTTTVTPAGTASPFNEYVVQSGDNLFSIAQQFLAPGDDLKAFSIAIANLNGLDPVDPLLHIGQKLLLPKPR